MHFAKPNILLVLISTFSLKLHKLAKAEISYFYMASGVNQYIFWFDISVNAVHFVDLLYRQH
jgi:hypothetical protein